MSYLSHYGVKGMRWGVRRYQNKDGSWTNEGIYRKRAMNANKNKEKVDSIVRSMSDHDRYNLGMEPDEKEYLTSEQGAWVVKRLIKEVGDTPVAFLDFLNDGDNVAIAIGTRGGDEYRNKGYASQLVKEGMEWYDRNKDRIGKEKVFWAARTDNASSRRLAEKNNFKMNKRRSDDDWTLYEYKKK